MLNMRWLGIANLSLLSLLLLSTCNFFFSKKESPPSLIPRIEPKELPKSPFAEFDEFFSEMGPSLLNLNWALPQMQLPDLRQELIFCGKNARPDALVGKTSCYFTLKTSQERALICEEERVYLIYQGFCAKRAPIKTQAFAEPLWGEASTKTQEERSLYVFSPGNQPTPLWLEIRSLGDQKAEVRVSMLDEKGALVTSPPELRTFSLQLQEPAKSHPTAWELGGQRVDGTLLVRQKARWIGKDLFLEMHGGEEFAHTHDKERVDFMDGAELYSCFVALGDFLIWKEGRWHIAQKNDSTQCLPLLVVKKIDEKLLSFELWDPEGKSKVLLNLMKTKEHSSLPNVAQEFKFVGAKTWAQFIVECRNGERMTLKPCDWLVLTPEGWVKLDQSHQIDAYVTQSISGPLFILEKMEKRNGRQVLIGHIFNATRTEVELVELTAASPSPLTHFYHSLPITPPIQPKLSQTEGNER